MPNGRTTSVGVISIAPENVGAAGAHVFGAVAASGSWAGVPRPTDEGASHSTTVSYTPIACEMAVVGTHGDPRMRERSDTRSGFYHRRPRVQYKRANSTDLAYRGPGTMTLKMDLQPIGSATEFATYAAMPVGILLDSCMHNPGAPSVSTDTVSADVSTTRFTPTTATGNYQVGGGFRANINARSEFSFITGVDTGNMVHSPALSAKLEAADGIRLGHTWCFGAPGATPGSSFSLRSDGDGERTYYYGCRVSEWTIEAQDGDAGTSITFVISFAAAIDDHGNADVDQTILEPDGEVVSHVQAYCVFGEGMASASAPAELSRSTVGISSYSIKYTSTLTQIAHGDTVVGDDWKVANPSAEATITISDPTTALDGELGKTDRSLLIGFDGGDGAGQGACFHMPRAILQTDTRKRDRGGDTTAQPLTFKQGLWAFDDSSTLPANTYARLFLAL